MLFLSFVYIFALSGFFGVATIQSFSKLYTNEHKLMDIIFIYFAIFANKTS